MSATSELDNRAIARHLRAESNAALARGGFVVPRTPGGSLFRMGEGLHDEAVARLICETLGKDGLSTRQVRGGRGLA